MVTSYNSHYVVGNMEMLLSLINFCFSNASFIGREMSATEQYGLVFLISLPLLFLASAGSTIFWIIGYNTPFLSFHV